MPVSVSLEALVLVPRTRDLWPERFREFIDTLQTTPDERTTWLALADWCDEEGEPGMAEACRLVGKKPEIEPIEADWVRLPHWTFRGLPKSIAAVGELPELGGAAKTLAAPIAGLAQLLRKRREEWA